MDKESCRDVTVSRYRMRKEKGLCPRCGKPNDSGFSICEKCREEDRITYHWYESHGFCPNCHHESAPNHKLCAVCLVKESERNTKRRSQMTEDQKIRRTESIEQTRRKHIEQGVCAKCWKHPSWDGRQLCYECTLKQRRRNNAHKRKYDYKDPNGCFRCGKTCVKGKRLCPEHYKISCDNIKKARESSGFIEGQARNKAKIEVMWSEMIWKSQQNAS